MPVKAKKPSAPTKKNDGSLSSRSNRSDAGGKKTKAKKKAAKKAPSGGVDTIEEEGQTSSSLTMTLALSGGCELKLELDILDPFQEAVQHTLLKAYEPTDISDVTA